MTISYKSRFLEVDQNKRVFRVSRDAYRSQGVFEEEKEKILYKTWIVLGHESEIPNKNDFVTRQVIDRQLILTATARVMSMCFTTPVVIEGLLYVTRNRAVPKASNVPTTAGSIEIMVFWHQRGQRKQTLPTLRTIVRELSRLAR